MKNKIIYYMLISLFTIVTIYGIYKIIQNTYEKKISIDTYNSLKEYTTLNETETQSKYKIDFPTVDFTSLNKINKDIVAWISIDNLEINYPIVKGSDNKYYLRHMVDGTYNKSGSIYMDYRNNSDFSSKHTIIYGHNFQNGTMFSNITKYNSQEYYNQNPEYTIVTETSKYVVQIISGYVTDTKDESWIINFNDTHQFETWIHNTTNKSLFKSNIIPTIEDKFVTLSTCSYEFTDARFILVGIIKST